MNEEEHKLASPRIVAVKDDITTKRAKQLSLTLICPDLWTCYNNYSTFFKLL